jgi:gamma-glutamyltranspeptidase / glutathione hydrolase / leukotriene-C4 hydrolase
MDDFSIPLNVSDGLLPSPANFIAPKKNPMSSMSPVIVLDEKRDVQLVLGGAGGILIMSNTSFYAFN